MIHEEIDFDYLRGVVMSNSGNLIDASRNYLFESRLQRMLRSNGWQSLEQLICAMRSGSGDLHQAVAEAMTINETSFFRDMPTFDLLREELLPRLITRRSKKRTLRFWSAASSSGQEAYSIAMLICEHFPQLANWKIEILGSDFSAQMIRQASTGRYQRIEVNRGLPARLLIKYLVRVDDAWEMKPEIKSMCQFQRLNLCQPTITCRPFDFVFLRNVMFYFPQDERQNVLLKMHQSLAPDGALILGLSEQPQMDSHWQTMLTPKAVWYRPID
jgi:chemotaxis protein methyltransferase CheR